MQVVSLLTEGGARGIKRARRPYGEVWEQDALVGAFGGFELGEKRPRFRQMRALSRASLEWFSTADQAGRRHALEATDLSVHRLGYAGGGARLGAQVTGPILVVLGMVMIGSLGTDVAVWLSGILMALPVVLYLLGVIFFRRAHVTATRQHQRLLLWRRNGSAR